MRTSRSSTTVADVSPVAHQSAITIKLGSQAPIKSRSSIHTAIQGKKPTATPNAPDHDGSPNTDWQLRYRPPVNTGHHVWESPAEQQAKRTIVHGVVESAPKNPAKLDAARLKNILYELNVHFRVAQLLPILLTTHETENLELLGEDVNRCLELIKLQTILAGNIIGDGTSKDSVSGESLASSEGDSLDSELNGEQESQLSVEEKQESQEERLRNRLSLAATSRLFSFKETFTSLCIAFRDTCDYELLEKAEELFSDSLGNTNAFPVVRKLNHLSADMMRILLNGIETTPFESREVQKVIQHMEELNAAAEGTMRLLWGDFKKTLDENKSEHDALTKTISKNQAIITGRLKELHEVRLKAQAKIHRQAEDDNGPHRKKLAKTAHETRETEKILDARNKQFMRIEKDFLKQMRDAKAFQGSIEIAVLERCVAVKTEIMALQDRGEILREYLFRDLDAEKQLEEEMNILLKDRKERDERRRLAEAEALRRNNAAIMIQKWFRGYMVRKWLRKKKKKKAKGKKKGKSKGDKTTPKGGAAKKKPAAAAKKKAK